MSIKVVVIGLGWAGQIHAQAVQKHPQTELTAVVDNNSGNPALLELRRSNIPRFGSLDELHQNGIHYDGALICTLPDTHTVYMNDLIERQKHVLCEKPLSRSAEEILRLINKPRDAGLKIGVSNNQRFAHPYARIKACLRQDERVHMIQVAMQQNGPVTKNFNVGEYFLITDACCHMLDTLMYLNGGIKSVFAFGKKIDSEIISDVTVSIEFENGSLGTMSHTFVGGKNHTQHPFQTLEISTSRARYLAMNMVDSLQIFPHDDMYSSYWSPSVFMERDYQSTIIASVNAWIDSIVKDIPVPVNLMDAYSNARVIEAVISSIKTGKAVQINT